MLKDTEKKLHDRGKKVRAHRRIACSKAHFDDCEVSRTTVRLTIRTHIRRAPQPFDESHDEKFNRVLNFSFRFDSFGFSQSSGCARVLVELKLVDLMI